MVVIGSYSVVTGLHSVANGYLKFLKEENIVKDTTHHTHYLLESEISKATV